jgi:hypothetical protein
MTEIDKDKLIADTSALHAFNDDIVRGSGRTAARSPSSVTTCCC